MSRPKVFVTRPDIPKVALDMLMEKCDVELYDQLQTIPKADLVKGMQGKNALFCLLTDTIDKDVIRVAGSNLKAIATMSASYDHIDLKECRRRKIAVGHTPEVETDSVAEFAVCLMLAAGRKLMEATMAIDSGDWYDPWSPVWLCGQGLKDATVGIVGMGRIGMAVAKRVIPFGVEKVLYYDLSRHMERAEKLGAKYADFDELVSNSDFVVATCNLTDQTRNLFSNDAFDKMKPNAVFVNVSRGGVVDQKALYDALKSEKIRAAAIDVTDPEPLPADHELTTLPNIIITPHVASAEINVRNRMAKLTAENILKALDGKPMRTPVLTPLQFAVTELESYP